MSLYQSLIHTSFYILRSNRIHLPENFLCRTCYQKRYVFAFSIFTQLEARTKNNPLPFHLF